MAVVLRFPGLLNDKKAQDQWPRPITLAVLVAHAPISSAPPDEKGAFYDSLVGLHSKLSTKHGKSLRVLVLGDFNAKLGSLLSTGVGPVGAEDENESGTLLREFAD